MITGASSGIGKELTRLFAANGYDLVLVGRHKDTLKEVADKCEAKYGVSALCVEADLSTEEGAEAVYKATDRRGLDIDVLVNNAGEGEFGDFAKETSLRHELEIMHTNMISPVVLTKHYLPEMLNRGKGRILFTSSMVSVTPNPYMSVYSGTKAFLLNFVEALRNEIKDSNVSLTTLMPGMTETDWFNKAGAEHFYEAHEGEMADPADVAQAAFDGLMAGKDKVVPGFVKKVMEKAAHLLPDTTLAAQQAKSATKGLKEAPGTKERRKEKKNREKPKSSSISLGAGLAVAVAAAGAVALAAKPRNARKLREGAEKLMAKGRDLVQKAESNTSQES